MGKEEELKITKLSMLVELNNGKVYQLITTSENRDMYLEVIEQYEKGIKLIEEPLEDIEIKTKIMSKRTILKNAMSKKYCDSTYFDFLDEEELPLIYKAMEDYAIEKESQLLSKIDRLESALEKIQNGTHPFNEREAFIFVDVAKQIASDALLSL